MNLASDRAINCVCFAFEPIMAACQPTIKWIVYNDFE